MLNALLRRPRRLLATLALLLAATGVAVGSGASFSSESVNATNTFSAGTLTQSNSKAGAAVLTASNMKPGDQKSGTVTITNTGSLGGAFSLTETSVTENFTTTDLRLVVTEEGSTGPAVYSGPIDGLGTKALGDWAKNEARTYKFVVTFPETNADQNADQGKAATASFSWNAKQLGAKDLTNDSN